MSSAESADDMDVEDIQAVETVPTLHQTATPENRALWLDPKNSHECVKKIGNCRAMKAQQLEEQAAQLSFEKEMWKTRAETLKGLSSSRGIHYPNWDEYLDYILFEARLALGSYARG
ncbi:hypothetical protein DL96DRAFT_1557154 [Flagelloscypha sp. PMI_526]|nr:hypothetical protein DL96DRAFT_1557154 [Flagelloscypha sp. PMI_526]